ncbi:DUF4309 domain-containing protein [Bacillus sp. AFS031507]|uniref:DUF4309 domain-containing protein n=1 Tax=Bacillus sp. AFS031507 TaxID=2033496 RepID=UPI000BFB88B9|nr:DUF4309 domain-containing protein [Bacillus sp. AFS031507]PGY07116.1 hypothetical protein COE25_25250 [Bacillus sp. AFS031507]
MKLYSFAIYSCILILLIGCNPNNITNQSQSKTNATKSYQDQSALPTKNMSSDVGTNTQNTNEHRFQTVTATIPQIVSAAKTGMAPNIPFTAHKQSISDVKKVWGNPDSVDFAGSGYYATYSKKHAVFGYTKAGRIFDVRSYDPSLQAYTLSSIKKVMGNPATITVFNNDNIYTYKVNSQFQLKWIIPKSTGKVNHISVFSPSDIVIPVSSYILPIKGTSQKLTASAWQRMVQWRHDILAFPKSYPNDVFVNGPNKKMVALTFDDGPDLINTPKIIATLKQKNVKGTFFFIGQKVLKYPSVVKSAYNNGNEIASHSFYHHELPKETAAEIHQDLQKTADAFRKVIGKAPALLRPPYGETDSKLVSVAKKDHYKIIIWSIDTLDWSQREHVHIEKNVFDNVRNGDIILMHSDEDKIETAKAVPVIIDELKRRGFKIVDLATLLNTRAYQ